MRRVNSLAAAVCVAAVSAMLHGACAEKVGEFTLSCRARIESLPTPAKGDGFRSFYSFGDKEWELVLVWNSANGAPYRQIWVRFNHVEDDGTKRLFAIYQRDLPGLSAGTWHHFVITYSVSSSEMKLYMDGFLIGKRSKDYENEIALKPLKKPTEMKMGPNLVDLEFIPKVIDEAEVLKRAGSSLAAKPSGNPFIWGSVDPTGEDVRYFPNSQIPPEAVARPVSVVVAKGEVEPCSILVKSGTDVKGLVPMVGQLKSKNGDILPEEAVDIRVVKVVPTAAIYPSVRGSRILKPMMLLHDDSLLRVNLVTRRAELKLKTPEGFKYVQCSDDPGDKYVQQMVKDHKWLNQRYDASIWQIYDAKKIQPLDLPADTLKQYWITVRINPNQKSGTYETAILLKNASGKVIERVPFSVRVLPFRLPEAKVKYDIKKPYRRMLYTRHTNTDFDNKTAGSITTNGRNLDQFRADLKNIREHGIESASIMMDLKLPCWRWHRWGKHDDPSAGEIETRTNRVNRAYSVKAIKVLAEEGLVSKPLYLNNGCNFGFREGYTAASKATLTRLVDETKSILREALGYDDMCVYAVDEAKGDAITRQYEAWKELQAQGVKIYATCLPKNVPLVAEGRADAIVQSVKPTKENAAIVHAYGGVILTYAYPQSGAKDEAYSYRACYGFCDWLMNYDGFSLYCWDEYSGNPWNEFENWGGKSYIYVFLTADGVVDTPSWEGQREAVDDVRYATLLKMLNDPASNEWLDSIDPFAKGFNPSKVRAEIIERILRLKR